MKNKYKPEVVVGPEVPVVADVAVATVAGASVFPIPSASGDNPVAG